MINFDDKNIIYIHNTLTKVMASDKFQKPMGEFKRIFEKLVDVKISALKLIPKAKSTCIKSLKTLLVALKSIRGVKSRSSELSTNTDEDIVCLLQTSLLGHEEQYEQDLKKELDALREYFIDGMQDSNSKNDLFNGMFASIYRNVRMPFEKECCDNNTHLPEGYLKELGLAAEKWNLGCVEEKNGILAPKAWLSDGVMVRVISVLGKKYFNEMHDSKYTNRIKNIINTMVNGIFLENGMKSPLMFQHELAQITNEYKKNS